MEHIPNPQKDKSVLIVEDERPLLRAIQEKLEKDGYGVLIAKNGQDALTCALDQRPDLILLDIMMPVMDGETFLKELRSDAWGRDCLVMVLTNLGTDSPIASKIETYNPVCYLVKTDCTLEQLQAKINETLQ